MGMVRSVAVLDFANLSADAELAWLTTGIPETVTNDLTGFRVLRVVDRVRIGEAVRRTDGSMTAVARELDVHLVVVGSFQRQEKRITARLVDVPMRAPSPGGRRRGLRPQDRIVASSRLPRRQDALTSTHERETSEPGPFRAA
jgi:TolB-like protein